MLRAGKLPTTTEQCSFPPGYKVTVAIGSASVKIGRPIIVKLSSKNVSPKVTMLAEVSPDTDYGLIVVDSSGKELPRTAFGDEILYANIEYGAQPVRREMKPGQEIRSEIEVTRIYKVNQPGVYYMWAYRDPSPDPGDRVKPPFEESSDHNTNGISAFTSR